MAIKQNGFRLMQERLRAEGWFVEWGMACCQSCAWGDVPPEHEVGPFIGHEVEQSKILMNHEQDCEVDTQIECPICNGDGLTDYKFLDDEPDPSQYNECTECDGEGYRHEETKMGDAVWFETMYCNTPEAQGDSVFMFDGTEEGVKNLKAVLPIIEECGCTVRWNGSGKQRPDISWEI